MGRTLGVAASLLVLILLTVVAVMTMRAYNELSAANHAVVTAEREVERARVRQAAARPGVGDLDAQVQAALETVTDATRSYDDLRRSYPTLVVASVAGFRERPLPVPTPTRPPK
jgi:hypothetical protein